MNTVPKIDPKQATPVSVPSFDEAFVKLQSELGPARKLATNPAFKSKYADLGAVWDAIMDPLHANGFGLMQIHQFEGENDYLETILIHAPSRDRVTGRYRLRPTRQDPQGYGSATTYARRYAACAMLGVVADEDDDGAAASAPASKPSAAAPKPTAASITEASEQDQDGQVTNWVNQQKAFITECTATEFLKGWKKRNDAAMGRLETRNPKLWNELMDHYANRYEELYTKEKQ